MWGTVVQNEGRVPGINCPYDMSSMILEEGATAKANLELGNAGQSSQMTVWWGV